MRYFVLMSGNRETNHVFTGSQPRRAALKAATRGFKDIRLRERGTDRLHIFKGSRKRIRAPEGSPDWLPSMVWKPVVRKVRLERLGRKRAAPKRTRRTRRTAKRASRRTARRRTARKTRRARRR